MGNGDVLNSGTLELQSRLKPSQKQNSGHLKYKNVPNLGLDATEPHFGVSDEVRFK